MAITRSGISGRAVRGQGVGEGGTAVIRQGIQGWIIRDCKTITSAITIEVLPADRTGSGITASSAGIIGNY